MKNPKAFFSIEESPEICSITNIKHHNYIKLGLYIISECDILIKELGHSNIKKRTITRLTRLAIYNAEILLKCFFIINNDFKDGKGYNSQAFIKSLISKNLNII